LQVQSLWQQGQIQLQSLTFEAAAPLPGPLCALSYCTLSSIANVHLDDPLLPLRTREIALLPASLKKAYEVLCAVRT